MTKDEILNKLDELGIITSIGEEFFITEKYKELLSSSQTLIESVGTNIPKVNYDDVLDGTGDSKWPDIIIEATGRTRARAVMNYCDIPTYAKGDFKYRLRGVDKEASAALTRIIESDEVDPNTFLDAIKIYYKHSTSPKSFKNFIKDGDILDVYNEHIAGELEKGLKSGTSNNSSGTWK